MTGRNKEIAEKYGILDKMETLESQLKELPHAVDVEFDLNGFLSNIYQVIIILEFKIDAALPMEEYFAAHRNLIKGIFDVAKENDLFDSGDSVEDMGTHYYIVTGCGQSWRQAIEGA